MKKNFKSQPWFLPQPVCVLGTYNADGTPNAMNAAWAGQWDNHQIMISLGSHATNFNLDRNKGEFTLAFATRDTLVAADYVGIVSGRREPNKVEKTGWKATKAQEVNAPVFDQLPLTLECRTIKKLDVSETGYYLIAEIVNIQCDERYLAEDGKPDMQRMQLITYDPIHHTYVALGETVGHAFSDGKQLQ